MSSTYVDYLDRTVDLAAFNGQLPSGGVPLQMVMASEGEGGQIVTGILKLSQRFTILLLTPLGSIPSLPNLGTDFMPKLQQGLLRTPLDVYATFSSAVSDIRDQLRAAQLETDPDDEKFASASIEALQLTGDYARVTILINSVAGIGRKVIFPLAISV